MAGRLFDVYLTGATDSSPTNQMRLATTIAARFRLSAPVVAEALEGVACRVGANLGARDAQAMAETLMAWGATARVSPAGGAPPGPSTRPTPSSRPPSPAPLSEVRPSDDFMVAPAHKDGRITLKSAEFDTGPVVDVSEPIEFAEPGPGAKTGARGPDNIRCPVHGLLYNRRKASGCVRCLASARARADQVREQSRGHASPAPSDADDTSVPHYPVRRAFWGLGIALLVGFLPAAYYARRVNRGELLLLRARQADVALQPVTQESLARFDALDIAVDEAYRHGAIRTVILWAGIAALAGAAWFRITRPRDST